MRKEEEKVSEASALHRFASSSSSNDVVVDENEEEVTPT